MLLCRHARLARPSGKGFQVAQYRRRQRADSGHGRGSEYVGDGGVFRDLFERVSQKPESAIDGPGEGPLPPEQGSLQTAVIEQVAHRLRER